MRLVILGLFVAVPILEIAVFIQVGGLIGLWPTIALVLLTAVAGTSLLRAQGVATFRRAEASLQRGEMPLREVFDGACLLVAGVLLLTPGFVTDTLGLVLFLPPVRAGLLGWLAQAVRDGRIHVQATMGGTQGPRPGQEQGQGPGQGQGQGQGWGPRDIEGEYRDVTPGDTPQDGPKRLNGD